MSLDLFYPDEKDLKPSVFVFESEDSIEKTNTEESLTNEDENISIKKETILVVPEKELEEEEKDITDEMLFGETTNGVLPEIKTAIDVVSDKQEKIINLQNIEAQLMGQQTVTREMASYIHEKTDSLFNNRIILESYTTSPSKTLYKETLAHLKQFIAVEQAEIALIAQNLSKTFSDSFITQIPESFIATLHNVQSGFEKIKNEHHTTLVELSDKTSTKFTFRINNEFVSLASLPISTLNIETIELFTPFKTIYQDENVEEALSNISELLKCNYLTGFFYSMSENKPLTDVSKFSTQLNIRNYINQFTLSDLADLFINNNPSAWVDNIIQLTQQARNRVYEISSEIKNEESDINTSLEWIRKHTQELNNLIEFFHFVTGFMGRSVLLNSNLSSILIFIKPCVV